MNNLYQQVWSHSIQRSQLADRVRDQVWKLDVRVRDQIKFIDDQVWKEVWEQVSDDFYE